MTAEELLMMSDDVEAYSTDDALVIDAENRIILTPAGGLLLGVESDEESERIKFICPRIVGDNIDLSTLQLRAIYKNANGDKDFRICTDITIDGENIRFSWSLSRKVTRYKGMVNFIICAIRTQSDGSIKNEWNTTLAEGTVLEGLEVDISEEEFEEPKDIVLQLLGMLDEKASDISDAIEAQKAEVISAIQAEEKRVMETIPEDYAYIANLAEENKQLKANAIKRTYSGETIVATDSSQAKFEGLRVFGRSEQVSTTGAQLGYIDIAYNEHNGLNFIEDNGNIIVNGTSTSTIWNRLIRCELVAGEKYTLSANENLNLNIWDFTSSSSLGGKSFGKTSKTFTAPNTGQYGIVLGGEAYALSNIKANIMVNIGTEALPYEPYTGGKPSPSPDYPQPIESVGDDGSVDVGVYGKNLLPYPYSSGKNKTINGVTFSVKDNGSISVKGTNTGTNDSDFFLVGSWGIKNNIGILPKTDLLLTAVLANIPKVSIKAYGFAEDGTTTDIGILMSGSNGLVIPKNLIEILSGICVYVSVNKNATVDTVIYPMIRLATIANTTYEQPYTKQSLSITTLNGLPAIKVTDASIATYTDADGVMWCADEVDFARGKYVQRVLCDRVSSALNWMYSSSTNRFYANDTRYRKASNSELQETYCNGEYLNTHFKNNIASSISELPNMSISYINGSQSGYSYKYFALNGDVDAWKAFLDENEVYTLGILSTPIETDLTTEEIEAYKALQSNYPTTTVLNDENAYTEVTLVADTKNHIEQNYVPKSEFLSVVDRVSALEQKALA